MTLLEACLQGGVENAHVAKGSRFGCNLVPRAFSLAWEKALGTRLALVAFYCVLVLSKLNGTTTSSSVSPGYQHGAGCFGLGVFFTNILPSSVRSCQMSLKKENAFHLSPLPSPPPSSFSLSSQFPHGQTAKSAQNLKDTLIAKAAFCKAYSFAQDAYVRTSEVSRFLFCSK